jgi:hypothetical protein
LKVSLDDGSRAAEASQCAQGSHFVRRVRFDTSDDDNDDESDLPEFEVEVEVCEWMHGGSEGDPEGSA